MAKLKIYHNKIKSLLEGLFIKLSPLGNYQKAIFQNEIHKKEYMKCVIAQRISISLVILFIVLFIISIVAYHEFDVLKLVLLTISIFFIFLFGLMYKFREDECIKEVKYFRDDFDLLLEQKIKAHNDSNPIDIEKYEIHGHYTTAIQAICVAIQVFWVGVDIDDKKSYPKHEDIVKFLCEKGYVDNPTLAKRIAQIIEPEYAKNKGRPSKN